ncbi:tRNA (adenosine(37)-N6)-threonylcarbamoyltransferase complex dimerization subunit type 1 TsaB [Crocosphaera sp. XPORK-15E]|uniref:tRNA (adenosine(37)-N6)-threonylcarbamoyltransferase complex dimerization subunit type 1 TsaB n=1 Tax=Crocosphaera sp. XPORK-15E TaxID=3110247 RepID=UPI002B20CC79|nr:tRNA (adenosine(37)-N6)-threonylcarbamoyltransferase complex dimerization subunit type 1 TsaB [Crocosphaera sp. XPORK-15E]MEA5536505.1 tRNA (adenosine(37)-N6)-threonylcarbamoyltransferase complex dimerization subunit type 1 TsaB [Crocosphaera sp. XPORK-15E]
MTSLNSPLYGLALHTTSSQLGLSLSDFAQETYTKTWEVDRELSNYLHQYLLDFIAPKTWQDFKFIAVAKGPGSFTSTRIGMVTARTLSQQLNIPLFGVSTLAAFAWFHQDKYDINDPIPVQMKASRGQLYGAIYTKNTEGNSLNSLLVDTVMMPEEWEKKLQDLQIFSQPLITPSALGMTANSVLKLANHDWQQGKRPHWSEAIPFYGMSVVTN